MSEMVKQNSTTTMQTSMSTLDDMFQHSITDLDSFSTSLDFDSHLPSVEARESFLSQFMEEEEFEPEGDDFQSSFACDLERSIPARLGTIDDQTEEEEEDDDDDDDISTASLDIVKEASLAQSNHCVSSVGATAQA